MTAKKVAMLLVFTGAVAVVLALLRPESTTSIPVSQPIPEHRRDVTPVVAALPAYERPFAIGRNIFSFVQPVVAPRPSESKVVRQEPVVRIVEEQKPPAEREPEFPYKYIGRFGSEANQIAVFTGNGDVINARVGDSIDGQFRLSRLGHESVDIASGSGSVRRLTIQP